MSTEEIEAGARLKLVERQRSEAVDAIVSSLADKKLVVAGPGTGKTYTFRQALLTCGGKGLALTFIRNLAADLKETLGDVADVFTFHGFCKYQMHRRAVAGLREGWDYYPALLEILTADLSILDQKALTRSELERCLVDLDDRDRIVSRLLELGEYYNAVSHTDLVYRVLTHFKAHDDQIPEYPLIVVDEYQDFSLLETSFIGLLATKSRVLIAGDDDQALYGFKNASARYIRELAENADYERFELPYCSRCTTVIVEAVKAAITAAIKNGNLRGRLEKQFECYLPDRLIDSKAHPKIIHACCTVERNSAKYIGRYVTEQIAAIPSEDIQESHASGYPTVLVIGPNPFLQRAYEVIKEQFPQVRLKMASKTLIESLDGYRRLAMSENSRLGWRILICNDPFAEVDEVLTRVLEAEEELAEALPPEYRVRHLAIAALVRRLLDGEALDKDDEAELCAAAGKSIEEIRTALAIEDNEDEGENEEVEINTDEPTIICTSLVGAKGLSGGYVYVVGFNNEHFPRDPHHISDDDVCCFLVALSRTRKECHLVSCKRFGNIPLEPSKLGHWIAPHLEEIVVDAAYFRRDGRENRREPAPLSSSRFSASSS